MENVKLIFQCLLALFVLVSPVFVNEDNIWRLPYILYWFLLTLSAAGPFTVLLSFEDLEDSVLLSVIFLVMLIVLGIPGIFSCHKDIHLIFLAMGGAGQIINFGILYVRWFIKKKYRNAKA